MTAVLGDPGSAVKRRGPEHWIRSTLLMSRLELLRMRLLLPMTIVVQLFTGVGLVLGVGLLFDDISTVQAGYLATGAVVVTMVTIGVVMAPQLLAQLKMAGAYEFNETLPIPRSSATVAWLVLSTAMALPGAVAALIVAGLRYDLPFDVDWGFLALSVVLVLVTGTMFGYALAQSIPKPSVTNLVSQVMIFVVFGFTPISFPAENLPDWLVSVHDWFPFMHMANAVRGSLIPAFADGVERSLLIMAAWSVAATALTAAVVRRRG